MSGGIDLSKVNFPDTMDLRTAAMYLGISEMRVRTLSRQGTLKATKDAETKKWMYKKADLDAFKAAPKVRGSSGPRGEGKAWVITIKHEDLEKVRTALKPFGIELQPRYNVEAQKSYRAKREAAKKAQKATPVGQPAAKQAQPVKQ